MVEGRPEFRALQDLLGHDDFSTTTVDTRMCCHGAAGGGSRAGILIGCLDAECTSRCGTSPPRLGPWAGSSRGSRA